MSNINISQQNIFGSCDLKCELTYNYPESNSTATNDGENIFLSYENGSNPPVLFNNQKYNVEAIYIFSPSIHVFNNVQAQGEIVIIHTPVSGGSSLLICIPIMSSSSSSESSNILTEIIQSVASSAPSEGDSTNLNISNFTLNNIIPKGPFYTYADSNNDNWIVYDIKKAINIGNTTANSLSQIITASGFPTQGTYLYYNSSGANASTSKEDIYISCQPTGSEGETSVSYEKQKNQTNYDLFSNPVFIFVLNIIIGCIFFIILYFVINVVYNFIAGVKPTRIAEAVANPTGSQ